MGTGTSSGRASSASASTPAATASSGNAQSPLDRLNDAYQRANASIRRQVTQAKWQANPGGGLERNGGSEQFNIPGIGMARVSNEVDEFGTRGFVARIAGVNDNIYPVNGGRAFDDPKTARTYAKHALAIRASQGYF